MLTNLKRPQLASHEINLAKPGIALQRIQSKGILLGEMPENCFGTLIDKIFYRARIKGIIHHVLGHRSRLIS